MVSVTVYTHMQTHADTICRYVCTYGVSMAGTRVHVAGMVALVMLSLFRAGQHFWQASSETGSFQLSLRLCVQHLSVAVQRGTPPRVSERPAVWCTSAE